MKIPPGGKCPKPECTGRMVVYTTRINFSRSVRVRYVHCGCCGYLPADNKWVVPLEYAPARK